MHQRERTAKDSQETSELIENLRQAGQQMTAEDVREQKVSFIMGSLGADSTITREEIKSELDKLPGQRFK